MCVSLVWGLSRNFLVVLTQHTLTTNQIAELGKVHVTSRVAGHLGVGSGYAQKKRI